MILRVLADYREPTLRAFETLLDDKKLIQRQSGSTELTLESYYKIRNIIFVSGNLGLKNAVAIVEKFVAESDQRVAETVVEALEKIGCERSARLLAGYLHSPSEKIKRKAISAVGNIGGPAVMPHLVDAYKSSPEMRSTLAPIIAKVGGEEAVEFLSSLLNRRESYIKEILSKSVEAEKIAVVSALARIKSTRSIAVLKEFRQSSSSGILGLFKSTALSQAVDRAISQIERDLSTGQNS
jgi:HEAT repeat protein